MPNDKRDELVSLLIARDRYRKLSQKEPKPYDRLVLQLLNEQIEYHTSRLTPLTRSV